MYTVHFFFVHLFRIVTRSHKTKLPEMNQLPHAAKANQPNNNNKNVTAFILTTEFHVRVSEKKLLNK